MADVTEATVLDDGTSEVIERDFTDEEKAQRATDAQTAQQADMQREADRQAALAKLAALGLTEADLHALGL